MRYIFCICYYYFINLLTASPLPYSHAGVLSIWLARLLILFNDDEGKWNGPLPPSNKSLLLPTSLQDVCINNSQWMCNKTSIKSDLLFNALKKLVTLTTWRKLH
jgi:hypothetical protein